MARDPVLIHAGNAANAEQRYGIPASVILGLLSVEGGTGPDGRPVAPADGLGAPSYGQFIYGTARSLGVKVGDSASEVDGIARYLVSLGWRSDPDRALGAYNGGPGNPRPEYAAKVRAAARRYGGFDGNGSGVPRGSVTSPTPATSATGLQLDAAQHGSMVRFGLAAGLVLVAAVAILAGGSRALGMKPPAVAGVG